ncbi:MAG: transposase [Pseudomonadota bacterium]
MAHLFWLSDAQWAAIEPLLPKNQPGARRVDDWRVNSGIIHVLKTGCRLLAFAPQLPAGQWMVRRTQGIRSVDNDL